MEGVDSLGNYILQRRVNEGK